MIRVHLVNSVIPAQAGIHKLERLDGAAMSRQWIGSAELPFLAVAGMTMEIDA